MGGSSMNSAAIVERLQGEAPVLAGMRAGRVSVIADHVNRYWPIGTASERLILAKFAMTVYAIDDELDSRAPLPDAAGEMAAFFPWLAGSSSDSASRAEIRSLLSQVECGLPGGRERDIRVNWWRSEGEAMVAAMWQEAIWRQNRIRPTVDDYLENGIHSISILWMASTMAGLSGESDVLEDKTCRAAVESAALAVRLLNDAATWREEGLSGVLNYVMIVRGELVGDDGTAEIDCQTRLRRQVAEFRDLADGRTGRTLAGIGRLVAVLLDYYKLEEVKA
jgi:hypothetical protein